jgi:hypothetical protein
MSSLASKAEIFLPDHRAFCAGKQAFDSGLPPRIATFPRYHQFTKAVCCRLKPETPVRKVEG